MARIPWPIASLASSGMRALSSAFAFSCSGVGTATIQRIEKSQRAITGYISTLVRIQAAFERAGIQFIDEDEMGGFGLRLAKKKRKR